MPRTRPTFPVTAKLPVSVHQWQTYHLEEFLGGVSALEAFEMFGMDSQIQYFESMGQFWLTDADFARKVAGRVALVGGVDQFNIVTNGAAETIRAKVHELFETVGASGGYICSLSDHFFETPLENLRAFSSAARECVY